MVDRHSVTYGVWKRGGGSGLHTLLYRSTDAAGNLESTQSCEVKIDARAPVTANDAPLAPQAGPVTVHLTAADSMFGVSACSDVASVTYSLDGGAPQTVPAPPLRSRSPAPACTGSLLRDRPRRQRRVRQVVQRDDPRRRPGEASDAVGGADDPSDTARR